MYGILSFLFAKNERPQIIVYSMRQENKTDPTLSKHFLLALNDNGAFLDIYFAGRTKEDRCDIRRVFANNFGRVR